MSLSYQKYWLRIPEKPIPDPGSEKGHRIPDPQHWLKVISLPVSGSEEKTPEATDSSSSVSVEGASSGADSHLSSQEAAANPEDKEAVLETAAEAAGVEQGEQPVEGSLLSGSAMDVGELFFSF